MAIIDASSECLNPEPDHDLSLQIAPVDKFGFEALAAETNLRVCEQAIPSPSPTNLFQ
jgi:hypothetical protein